MARRLDLPLLPSTKAPRRARLAITELLDRTGQPDLCPDAALLITELVTNAITHAGGPIGVSAAWLDGTLRVEVHDFESAPPVVRHPSILEESGRGLCLVADIADRWGIRPESHGKTVWFELNAVGSSGDGGNHGASAHGGG
jgi:anti-sigma regulatory factor (Ser/Thr protein kinase)